MLISKLDVAGFKSFGKKNTLRFQNGITAIIGPNGSGKSNIADAIRWVLGEQKISKLRVAKAEDVIFNGTDDSHQSSMAQVSIELVSEKYSNTQGESGEIVITRKLYRSGESELLLNGKKVKRIVIEELLAKSGFGTQTYTVVAQGMIDKLLTATGSERKMLFDEASGIRQYDIKRIEAYRNLKSAIQNLKNINLIITELSPAATILQKQSDSQMKLKELKERLIVAQTNYLNYSYNQILHVQNDTNSKIKVNSKALKEVTKKISNIKSISINTQQQNKNLSIQTNRLNSLERKKEVLTNKLYENKNLLDLLNKNKESLQPKIEDIRLLEKEMTNLDGINKKLNTQHLGNSDEIKKLQKLIDDLTDSLTGLNKNLDYLQLQINKSQKKEYILHAISLAREARIQLRQAKSRKPIDTTILKITKILELAGQDDATEMALSFSKLQNTITRTMSRREEIIERQTKDIIRLRSLELDISANQSSKKELELKIANLNNQIKAHAGVEHKISIAQSKISEIEKASKVTNKEIDQLRNILYQSNQNQSKDFTKATEIEKLTTEKTRYEFVIEQLHKDLDHNQQNLANLEKKALAWNINNYRHKNEKTLKAYTIDEIEDLTVQLRSIEQIDPDVMIEAKESAQRIEFLKNQQNDLQIAIEDTQRLIQSLQADMKKQFEKSFKKINQSFNKYFSTLFKGGHAVLELERFEEDYGIEIKVSPPGKRSKSINTLSGGEKALAAIALLAAIIVNNPSPFIVLDEVDAALDDENSKIFTHVLAELSKHSQILLITHNQETMQIANNLFGITNSKNGATEVLGLELNQADQYAKV